MRHMHEVLCAIEGIGPGAPQELFVAQTLKMFERNSPLAVVVFPEIVDFTRHIQFLSRASWNGPLFGGDPDRCFGPPNTRDKLRASNTLNARQLHPFVGRRPRPSWVVRRRGSSDVASPLARLAPPSEPEASYSATRR